jgi:ribose 1,5-bisphosphokinase PhnN
MRVGSRVLRWERDSAAQLELLFPDWRILEVFGPSGAGKSTVCRSIAVQDPKRTIVATDALHVFGPAALEPREHAALAGKDIADRKRIVAKAFRRLERAALAALDTPERRFLNLSRATYARHADRHGLEHFEKQCRRAVAVNAIARRSDHRVLGDEGPIKLLLALLDSRRDDFDRSDLLRDARRMLAAYPYEKNAILMTADDRLCVQRQAARGKVFASDASLQRRLRESAEQLGALCEESGWRVLHIDNSLPLDGWQPVGIERTVLAE